MSDRINERSDIASSAVVPIVVVTTQTPSATATRTSVAAAMATTTLLAANANRLQATVYNDSATATLYLALGAGATATDYTVQVPPLGYFELPNDGCRFTGIITGFWSAAVGNARVTELTP